MAQFENSPAIYGWVKRRKTKWSPAGTAEPFFRPFRDWRGSFERANPELKLWAIFKVSPVQTSSSPSNTACPPAGGLGLGQESIRDVILFPQLKLKA